jgi:outer membrane immunogenic protein
MFTNLLDEKRRASGAGAILLVAALLLMSAESRADSGFYVGGSVGSAGLEIDFDDPGDPLNTVTFDEDDFAWKAFAGYNFDLTLLNLAIEGGYVDLGGSSADLGGTLFAVDADGLDLFGVLGVDLGPIGIFAKAGVIAWDAEASIDGLGDSDDGTDPAYGVGAKFGFGSFAIRVEYELFDIEDAEDVAMISAGLVWTF